MGNSRYDAFDTDGVHVDHTDDLDAFDFEAPGVTVHDGDYGLDAFDVYQPSSPAESGDSADQLFSVTNPPGTVTVSAFFDGRVHRVELAPEAAVSTEEQLAAEIVVIAGLATQRAKAAQYSYMLEGMHNHGHDTVDTRDFLNRSVGLPSPEDADAAQAKIFSTRYAGEHD